MIEVSKEEFENFISNHIDKVDSNLKWIYCDISESPHYAVYDYSIKSDYLYDKCIAQVIGDKYFILELWEEIRNHVIKLREKYLNE